MDWVKCLVVSSFCWRDRQKKDVTSVWRQRHMCQGTTSVDSIVALVFSSDCIQKGLQMCWLVENQQDWSVCIEFAAQAVRFCRTGSCKRANISGAGGARKMGRRKTGARQLFIHLFHDILWIIMVYWCLLYSTVAIHSYLICINASLSCLLPLPGTGSEDRRLEGQRPSHLKPINQYHAPLNASLLTKVQE